MSRRATYLCGLPEELFDEEPCPRGGADHTPFPAGYAAADEYAAQLLSTGWTQHRCPTCGLWRLWRPEQPQPQPPMLPAPDGGVWTIPPDLEGEGCPDCAGGTAASPPACPIVDPTRRAS